MVGRQPGAERIFLATGFSGAGFKMAPAHGATVVDLALQRRRADDGSGFTRDFDPRFMDPARFG